MMDYTNLMSQALKRQESARGKSAFQSPEGRMVGGVYIAPNLLEYLSEALRSAGAGREAEMAGQEYQGYETQRTEGNQKALADFLRMSKGQAAQPEMMGNNPSAYTPPQAAVPGDMQGAYASLMKAPDQSMRQMGMQGMTQLPQIEAQKQEREDNRAFRTEESKLAREARAQELQQRMTDARASQAERLQAQKELREMQIQAQKDTQRMIAANRPERQAQIIQTEQGPMQLVGGKAVPIIGPDGKQVTGTSGVKTQPQTQKIQDAKDALSTITLAEKLIDEATGSGFGNVLDATAGFFGKSTSGAQGAARLKALEGDLVSKMPKMSGPQSDKDVLLYRQMAGTIGDPTIPRETKKAALETIREIQNRYAGVAPEGSWDSPQGMPNADAIAAELARRKGGK